MAKEGRSSPPSPGTTRDYLEAPCDCDGLLVDLVDTAGFEQARTHIEGQAQSARGDQSAIADLLLNCQAADTNRTELPNRPALAVWTKSDLTQAPSGAEFYATSASTGDGIDELRRAIAREIRSLSGESDLPAGTATRSGEGLTRAAQSLGSAAETLRLGLGPELVAVDLRQGLDDLGRVVGAVVTEDLLDRIFRRFCIGK